MATRTSQSFSVDFEDALDDARARDCEQAAALLRNACLSLDASCFAILSAATVAPSGPPAAAERREARPADHPYTAHEIVEQPSASPGSSVSRAAVEAALGLGECASIDDVVKRRRDFAIAHHPDRASANRRGTAEEAMKIANAIIDQRIAELKRLAAPPED